MAYHAEQGLYFERLECGRVRITKKETVPNPAERDDIPSHRTVMDITVSKDTWASIIASVCVAGEDSDTFRRAENFHAFGYV